jgi:hypothetical protein
MLRGREPLELSGRRRLKTQRSQVLGGERFDLTPLELAGYRRFALIRKFVLL